MIVSISCPYCKAHKAIKADIDPKDLEGSSIDYPECCPECHHAIGINEIADLQYQCLLEIHESMTESIYEKQSINNLFKRI